MRVISGVAGAILLLLTLGSILRNVVVPRGLGSLLTKGLWRSLHRVLISLAFPFDRYERRDRVLAWLAPLVLVGELALWLASTLAAYGLLVHAFSRLNWASSFREAGSSMFTLGFASNARTNLNAL